MKLNSALSVLLPLCNFLISCKAQPTFGTNYLKFEKVIVMPGLKGRIDHMDVNLKDKTVYIAALGNNTVEVVDIGSGKLVHSIKGLDEPQGVGYIPQTNEILIANGGNGDCYFYNAASFLQTAVVHLGSDADDVRYDFVSQKIYVGYGDGGIAMIDAATHQQTGDVKLPAHPEGFQLDKKANLLLVNLPDRNMIAAIDLIQLKLISKWKETRLPLIFRWP
jgi:DNA-binding beta-propeller fold protein YncE